MADIQSLLLEVHQILGNDEKAEAIVASEPTPSEVARSLASASLVDEIVAEALAGLDWYGIAQIASFSIVPQDELGVLARALAEGTARFRVAWREMEERFDLPLGLGRGGMILAGKISTDEAVVRRTVYLAQQLIRGAGPLMQEAVSKKYPAALYHPDGDKSRAKKAADNTKKYMTAHPAGTDKPDAKKAVMVPGQLRKAGEDEKCREKGKRDVEAHIKKLEAAAKKAGRTPEEMFPNIWRDLMREKIRHS
jgi:hypothetical protein